MQISSYTVTFQSSLDSTVFKTAITTSTGNVTVYGDSSFPYPFSYSPGTNPFRFMNGLHSVDGNVQGAIELHGSATLTGSGTASLVSVLSSNVQIIPSIVDPNTNVALQFSSLELVEPPKLIIQRSAQDCSYAWWRIGAITPLQGKMYFEFETIDAMGDCNSTERLFVVDYPGNDYSGFLLSPSNVELQENSTIADKNTGRIFSVSVSTNPPHSQGWVSLANDTNPDQPDCCFFDNITAPYVIDSDCTCVGNFSITAKAITVDGSVTANVAHLTAAEEVNLNPNMTISANIVEVSCTSFSGTGGSALNTNGGKLSVTTSNGILEFGAVTLQGSEVSLFGTATGGSGAIALTGTSIYGYDVLTISGESSTSDAAVILNDISFNSTPDASVVINGTTDAGIGVSITGPIVFPANVRIDGTGDIGIHITNTTTLNNGTFLYGFGNGTGIRLTSTLTILNEVYAQGSGCQGIFMEQNTIILHEATAHFHGIVPLESLIGCPSPFGIYSSDTLVTTAGSESPSLLLEGEVHESDIALEGPSYGAHFHDLTLDVELLNELRVNGTTELASSSENFGILIDTAVATNSPSLDFVIEGGAVRTGAGVSLQDSTFYLSQPVSVIGTIHCDIACDSVHGVMITNLQTSQISISGEIGSSAAGSDVAAVVLSNSQLVDVNVTANAVNVESEACGLKVLANSFLSGEVMLAGTAMGFDCVGCIGVLVSDSHIDSSFANITGTSGTGIRVDASSNIEISILNLTGEGETGGIVVEQGSTIKGSQLTISGTADSTNLGVSITGSPFELVEEGTGCFLCFTGESNDSFTHLDGLFDIDLLGCELRFLNPVIGTDGFTVSGGSAESHVSVMQGAEFEGNTRFEHNGRTLIPGGITSSSIIWMEGAGESTLCGNIEATIGEIQLSPVLANCEESLTVNAMGNLTAKSINGYAETYGNVGDVTVLLHSPLHITLIDSVGCACPPLYVTNPSSSDWRY